MQQNLIGYFSLFLIFQINNVENWPARFKVPKNIEIHALGYLGNDFWNMEMIIVFLFTKYFFLEKVKVCIKNHLSKFSFHIFGWFKTGWKGKYLLTFWNLYFRIKINPLCLFFKPPKEIDYIPWRFCPTLAFQLRSSVPTAQC